MKVKLSISKKYAFYVSALGLVLLTVMLISVGIIVWKGADTLREKLREGTKENYKNNYEIMIINRATNFSNVIFNSLYRLDIESINRSIKNLKMPIKSALIADASGKVLTDGTSENPSFGTKLDIDFSLLKSRQSLITHTTEGYKVAFTIALGDHVAGYGELLFSDDPLKKALQQQDEIVFSMWKETLRRFTGIGLIGILSILFFTTFLGLLFSRRLASPLLKLRDATKSITKGDLQHRLEIQSTDELGELADSFNRMAEELLMTTVSKDYVNNIIKNMNDSLIVVSPDGNIKTLNQATLNLLGYTEYELLNQPIGIIFEDKELASQWAGLIDSMKESSLIVRNIEKIYLSKDGRRIPVLFSSSVICDPDGKIAGVVCVALDITERKAAEEELRKHREHLEDLVKKRTIELTKANEKLQEEITERKRAEETLQENEEYLKILLNSIRTGIIAVDADTHNILDINPVAAEMIGLRKEQILGLPCHKFVCPAEVGKCPITDLKQTVSLSERRLLKATGEQIPILKSVVPMMRKNKRYLLESFVDITELKQADEALRRSEEEAKRLAQENAIVAEIGRIISSTLNIEEVYERFVEKVRELIPLDRVSINFINHKEQTSTVVYSSGVEVEGRRLGVAIPLSGTIAQEVLRARSSLLFQGKDLKEIANRFPNMPPLIQAGFQSIMSVPLISKDEVISIFHFRSKKPNAYTVEHLKLAERVGNQIAGAIANVQLFIERVQAEQKAKSFEEQLRQSQKIEAVGRLAGGIAHDFNNLLTVIKGYSDLALIKLKEDDPLKGNLKEIQKASQRATDLTRQLLTFSRRQILEIKVINLNTLLQDLDKMLHRVIGEDIELVYLLSDPLGKVRTDPSQIEQMILNLAVNARDAMPSGGKLTIETANVVLDEIYTRTHIGVKPGRYVMLSVSDTGCGMSPEVREHLFEPFFTTKEIGKGTGLGLSTVYGIVKQSGGEIWCYSEPGQGTTFKIYLPSVEEEVTTLHHEEDDKGRLPQGRETVLLVEDEISVRGFAAQVLRENGYKLLEAANGDDALRMAQVYAGKIHLLLTDVVMPQMGGKELAGRLKTIQPNIKVLFTSGYTDNAIVRHGVLEPGSNFLQKPFSPVTLAQKVREVLDR